MTIQDTPVRCRATLHYIGGERDVTIRDGRAAALPGWAVCGFERRDHRAAVTDWDDEAALAAVHHPEMAALAQQMTGCDHALVIGHIKRNPQAAAQHHDLAPISLVHSDFADSYGAHLRDRYGRPNAESAAALEAAGITPEQAASARRILVLQFWRNIGPAKMDLPLAFCDARTVPRAEVVAFPVTNYAGGGISFDALGVQAPRDPERHAWYGFDELRDDEVVAFRTYDSDRVGTGEPYWTPHSAYRDPDVELGRPSRSSIELRATCLFL
jgi:hypothetical protein